MLDNQRYSNWVFEKHLQRQIFKLQNIQETKESTNI